MPDSVLDAVLANKTQKSLLSWNLPYGKKRNRARQGDISCQVGGGAGIFLLGGLPEKVTFAQDPKEGSKAPSYVNMREGAC